MTTELIKNTSNERIHIHLLIDLCNVLKTSIDMFNFAACQTAIGNFCHDVQYCYVAIMPGTIHCFAI